MKIATLKLCLGLIILLHTLTLKAEEIIVVRGNEDYPPMEMIVNGVLTGFHVDIVNDVAKAMGISVQWISAPWKRALGMIKHDKVDGITYISRTPERERFAEFLDGNVLSSSTVNFFVLKENAGKYSFDGDINIFIENRTILKLRGFAFGKAFDALPSHEVDSMEQIILKNSVSGAQSA